MRPVLCALVMMAAMLGGAAAVQADPWRRHDGWDEPWRHDPWRWNRPHRHARPPSQVIMVYPPPPVVYQRQPRVVFVDPPPLPATPASPPYTDRFGRYCREYQSTLTVGGQPQRGYGTACQQPDGSWRIVE